MQPVVEGQVGSFDFVALLIQLTAGATLLSAATTVVDFLARYVMPHKEYYGRFMDQRTQMQRVLECDQLTDDQLKEALAARRLPAGGDRTQQILILTQDGFEPANPNMELSLPSTARETPARTPRGGGSPAQGEMRTELLGVA
mmetsp:Transcript_41867/g.94465  ORF Transcript_41867/g.94465 Transcript_41867/m.94465 type:complete len:143 (-) Transcript_41867:131-559(-)